MSNKLVHYDENKKSGNQKKNGNVKPEQKHKDNTGARKEMNNTQKDKMVKQDQGEKTMTKYDQKVMKRKKEAAKAARRKKITVISSIVIAVALITGILTSVWLNYDKIHHEYIDVDGKPISEVEFDFYYALSKQSQLSQTLYGSMTFESYFTSYMGYDASKSDVSQTYSSSSGSSKSGNTWYDYFAKGTVDTVKEYKALIKAADEKGYSYDSGDSDYQTFADQISSAASGKNESVSDYYKNTFGNHATEANLKPYIYEYLKAASYQNKLQTDLAATSDEVADYYNANKDSYDKVSYRSFTITADTAGDEASLAAAKTKADAFAAAVKGDDSFAALCQQYATSDQQSKYADASASLTSDALKSSMNDIISGWLFDGSRNAGDVTVLEDSANNQYYVLYFDNRTAYDTSADTTIASTVLSNKYSQLIKGYTDNMAVNNKSNRIKMLTDN